MLSGVKCVQMVLFTGIVKKIEDASSNGTNTSDISKALILRRSRDMVYSGVALMAIGFLALTYPSSFSHLLTRSIYSISPSFVKTVSPHLIGIGGLLTITGFQLLRESIPFIRSAAGTSSPS